MTSPATILYIEDDRNSQRLVERILKHAGYTVLIASRALQGIDMARQHKPDLILTDINLPDLSGREITVRLRGDAALKDVPIIALTAQSHAFERDKTIVAGVSGYLTKPVNIAVLTQTVEKYLQGYTEKVKVGALDEAQRAYNQELVERLEANVRDLEARNRSLRRIDQLKDDFIQLTAHELRTPLTTVYGYGSLVRSLPVVQQLMMQDAEFNASFSGLVESIDRMHTVVDEIIIVSRIASGRIDLKPNRILLDNLIRTVLASYYTILEQRDQYIEYNEADWQLTLTGDYDLLEMAISNLISNAIKYTPDGGTITLYAATQPGDKLRISVQDSGIGIDPDDQPLIFDQFYTAGDTQLHSTSKTAFRGGGLGLGLAICRGIVEAHHGRIWAESAGCDPEQMPGSTFIIELPLT